MTKDRGKRRRRQIRVASRRRTRALRSKSKAHWERFLQTCQPGQRPSRKKAWQRRSARTLALRRHRLAAPETFGLLRTETREALLRFISELRRQTLIAGQRILIDFAKTKKMWADGTLLFAAELDRIHRATRRRKLLSCNYPTDNVVEQVLQHLGLLEIMGRRSRTRISADDVRSWRMHTDTDVKGKLAEPLISEFQKLFSSEKATKMYNGLAEAMTNCKHHAYLRPRRDNTNVPSEERWWMFAESRDGKLSVAFCDLGIGINRSLRHSTRWAWGEVLSILARLGGRSDAYFIRAAMDLGKSRTEEPYRGHGLQDLKNAISAADAGNLMIYSNRGLYQYSPMDGRERLIDFRDSILGTLICWQIPIPRETS